MPTDADTPDAPNTGHAAGRRPASRDEIAALAHHAGLDLSPAHFDELVDAYGYLEPMLWRLRRGRDRADEPAHVFDPRKFAPPAGPAS